MSEELRFFLISCGITFAIFLITAIIEVFVLRAFKRLEAPKNLYYVLAANISGFVITIFVSSLMVFLFLAFFAAALGGVGSVALGSIVGIIVLLLLIPILIFVVRFLLFKILGLAETKFSLIYSLLSTIGVLVVMIALWSLVIFILSSINPNL